MLNKTFDKFDIYQKSLNASWLKNQAISNNIANVNTPGYKRKDVKFENMLKQQMQNQSIKLNSTHLNHFSNNVSLGDLSPQIETDYGTSFRKDKNNVNVDVEMAELTKNTVKFNAIVQQLNKNLNRIRLAITDGRR